LCEYCENHGIRRRRHKAKTAGIMVLAAAT